MIFKQLFGKKVEKETFLIVGLGNPGREYRLNRHNIGFRAADRLAKAWQIPLEHVRNKALVGVGQWHDYRIILAKPQTFMNLSSQAVSSLFRFYKIPLEKMLVIYDDLDLPLGTLRLRSDGGSAGHKGMTSIIQQLGSGDFPRLRLGIGHPGVKSEVVNWVLKKPSLDHRIAIEQAIDHSLRALPDLLAGDMVKATKDIHTAP